AVAPLAQIAGTNPAKILDEVGILEKDQDTIRTVAAQASGLIGSCAQDLLGLAMELGTRAMPLAMGLLVPHPAARTGAEAALKALAMEYLGRAMARTGSLVNELAAISSPLAEIASRTISSLVDGSDPVVQEQEADCDNTRLLPARISPPNCINNTLSQLTQVDLAPSPLSARS